MKNTITLLIGLALISFLSIHYFKFDNKKEDYQPIVELLDSYQQELRYFRGNRPNIEILKQGEISIFKVNYGESLSNEDIIEFKIWKSNDSDSHIISFSEIPPTEWMVLFEDNINYYSIGNSGYKRNSCNLLPSYDYHVILYGFKLYQITIELLEVSGHVQYGSQSLDITTRINFSSDYYNYN